MVVNTLHFDLVAEDVGYSHKEIVDLSGWDHTVKV